MLPGPSASEVTTLRRYANLLVTVIIFDSGTQFLGNEKICCALQKKYKYQAGMNVL